VVLLAAAVVAPRGSAAAGPALFDYDRSAPLDLVTGKSTTSAGVVRQGLRFTSGADQLAADFLHPASGGPWPLVVWSPGFGGGRRQQLPEALALARAGVASLLVDPPPRVYVSTGCDPKGDLANYVRYVISRRRALDVADTLPNVNTARIGAVGFSY